LQATIQKWRLVHIVYDPVKPMIAVGRQHPAEGNIQWLAGAVHDLM
jgi:hypothetical protein